MGWRGFAKRKQLHSTSGGELNSRAKRPPCNQTARRRGPVIITNPIHRRPVEIRRHSGLGVRKRADNLIVENELELRLAPCRRQDFSTQLSREINYVGFPVAKLLQERAVGADLLVVVAG